MRIELVDPYGNPYIITSRDPETLGRWILETFTTVRPREGAGYWRLMVWPSASYDEPGDWDVDWVADTRVLTQPMKIKTPADLLAALASQIEQQESLRLSHGSAER